MSRASIGAVRAFAAAFGGEVGGEAVETLVAGCAELGDGATQLAWYDGGDRIAVVAPWPHDDAALRARIAAASKPQPKTVPALRARRATAPWVSYETLPHRPALLSIAAGFGGPCEPADELRALAAVSIVQPSAASRMAQVWPLTGARCDLVLDRAQPPLGPNTWVFAGAVGDPHAVLAALTGALGLLPRHAEVARATGVAFTRVGVETVFDTVQPQVWLSGEPDSADRARAAIAAALGDDARAARVVGAFTAAGVSRLAVAIRAAEEEPVRVRVMGAVS